MAWYAYHERMNDSYGKKKKTLSKVFWRFWSQMVGAFGVFFVVLTIFQSTTSESIQWKQFLQDSFTVDADLAPVMQFVLQLDSPEEEAISVNAMIQPQMETIAVPVTGRVLDTNLWDDDDFLTERYAQGIWIATDPGEPICAAYPGTVTGLWEENQMYTIEVSHVNGVVTIYGCCAVNCVELNEPVKKSQIIGYTAMQEKEGNFYFAARYLGEAIDPLELLNEKIVDAS